MLVAPVPLHTIIILEVHSLDHFARGEVVRKIRQQGYWSPSLYPMVDEILKQCEICAQNNVKKGETTPVGHIQVPEGPFNILC